MRESCSRHRCSQTVSRVSTTNIFAFDNLHTTWTPDNKQLHPAMDRVSDNDARHDRKREPGVDGVGGDQP